MLSSARIFVCYPRAFVRWHFASRVAARLVVAGLSLGLILRRGVCWLFIWFALNAGLGVSPRWRGIGRDLRF